MVQPFVIKFKQILGAYMKLHFSLQVHHTCTPWLWSDRERYNKLCNQTYGFGKW